MLEKSSTIVLTKKDIELSKLGQVSERVANSWGLSLEQLQEVVDNNNYVLSDKE